MDRSLGTANGSQKGIQDEVLHDITNQFSNTVSIVTDDLDTYTRKAKEAFKEGNPAKSLDILKEGYKLFPNEKIKERIRKLQVFITELETQSDEEDEFFDVHNSGLLLNKRIYDNLYDHQKEGVAFLYGLHRDGKKGGVLADDMGLGKTIQVISFLCGMYDSELMQTCLLVMPTTLITNWIKEFQKWVPGMRVREFHGTNKVIRTKNLRKIQMKSGVLITSYQMVLNNWELLSSIEGREFYWDYVILDEAHKIKSSSTKTAKSVNAVLAKHRVLLTGTPVQNNLKEMWALFDFACQGSLLGTYKTFKTQYENPITRAREKDSTPGEKVLGLKMSQNLMDIIAPYFLRRTKADVQRNDKEDQVPMKIEEAKQTTCEGGLEVPSLPEKNDLIVWTYLSPIQEQIYRMFISLDHIKEVLMTTRSPLAELTILKKLCDHPRLLSKKAANELGLFSGEGASEDNENDVCSIDCVSDQMLISESGKLEFLIELLQCQRKEGNRTLVFSRSLKMLNIIQRILKNQGFKMARIDGTITDLSEREKRIQQFQSDSSYTVFLLTTQVGGVGLTLTSANRVVIFDPSWNPATDAQAVDRAYRIGQTQNVIVYRLITCGTVEEKIYRRQVFKDSLIRQTTGDNKNPFRYFSKQELRELFSLQDTRSSSTQMQLQELHSQQQSNDPDLLEHLAYLNTLNMFGISHHDLLFCVQPPADEDINDDEAHLYIEKRVMDAENLMRVESQIQRDLKEFEMQHTESRLVHQSTKSSRQKFGKCIHDDHDLSSTSPDVKQVDPNNRYSEAAPCIIDETVREVFVLESPDVELIKVVQPNAMGLSANDKEQTVAASETCTLFDTLKVTSSLAMDDATLPRNKTGEVTRKLFGTEDDVEIKSENCITGPPSHACELVCDSKAGGSPTEITETLSLSSLVMSEGVLHLSNDGADVSGEPREEQLCEEEESIIKAKKKCFVLLSDEEDESSFEVGTSEIAPSPENSRLSNMFDSLNEAVDMEKLQLSAGKDQDDVIVTTIRKGLIICTDDEEDEGEECHSATGSNQQIAALQEKPDEMTTFENPLEITDKVDGSPFDRSGFLTYSSEEEEQEEIIMENVQLSKMKSPFMSQNLSNGNSSVEDSIHKLDDSSERTKEDDQDELFKRKSNNFASLSSEGEEESFNHEDNFQLSSTFLSVSVEDRSFASVASRRSLVNNLMEKFEDILMDEESSVEMVESDQESDLFCISGQSF